MENQISNKIKKKILFISYEYYVEPAYEHYNQMKEKYDLKFLIFFVKDVSIKKKLSKFSNIIFIGSKQRKRNFLYWFFIEIKIIIEILRFKPSLIWYDELASPVQLFSVLIVKLLNYKILLSVHDVLPHAGATKNHHQYLRLIAQLLFNHFIVYSKTQQNILEKKFPQKKIFEKKLPIYSFSDLSGEKIEMVDENNILFFGNIYEYKNPKLLKELMQIFNKQNINVKFIIAGKDYTDIFKNYSSDNLESHLFFIPYNEVEYYFRKAKYVILPYISATQSGPLMNAFYYEKPLIVSDIESFKEYVEANKTGIFFNNNDLESLQFSIHSILENRNIYHDLVNNIRQKKLNGEFSNIYQSALLSTIIDNI